MADGPAVAIDGLRKDYGGLAAVNGVSLTIERGSFFGLLGPNGAGKTTLISILGGLTLPSAGTASIMGHDVVADAMAARRRIGIVPQEIVFDSFFTTRQYLRQQASYYGIYDNEDWIDTLLDRLGLADKANVNTRKLSGGMKRRMMVGMALVHRPPVVVLDEPTAGVDVSQRRSLWEFIQQLNSEGTTVILTTHYLEEAEEFCERIVMLDHGRVIADKLTADLLSSGQHHAHSLYFRLPDGAAPPAELFAPAQAKGPDSQGRFHIDFADNAELEDLLRRINASGLPCRGLEIAAPDLEDVFVELTRQP
ncbi:MAG: ABC transporter ATP-binding protein [Betaproteobacteria bacterium AqS2]|uniref:ABC transporter ATP-binding protein n=1 Tax=Candidatus Amphirhobacter heronislandensis TaxID=1732024 RepID=A0A930UH33_9GAMM|nr:ABC transporter ATP-binding protein [Betaproteobacteria bacterium AqS2]